MTPAARGALAAGGAALALYLLTLSPGVGWGDSAELQVAAARPEWSVSARGYPLWTLLASGLARLLPVSPALAANLLSALAGAAAVGFVFRYASEVAASPFAGAVAAAAVAVAHLFWTSAVATEVYAVTLLLLVLLLLAGRAAAAGGRAGPFALGLLTGLSLLHHRMLLVAAAALGVVALIAWVRDRRGPRPLAFAALGALVGAVPFALLAVAAAGRGGPVGVEGMALGSFGARLPEGLGRGLAGLLLYEARFLGLNLAGPQALFAAGGLLALRRPGGADAAGVALVGLLGLLQALFFPHVGDRYMLLLPAILATCVLAGVGAERWLGRAGSGRRRVALLLVLLSPPLVYFVLSRPAVADRLPLFAGARPEQARSFLWPPKRGDSAPRDHALRLLGELPEDAVLAAGWGEGQVLRYLTLVEGLRPDVDLRLRVGPPDRTLPEFVRSGRPVYASTYPWIPETPPAPPGTRLQPVIEGALWRLRPAR